MSEFYPYNLTTLCVSYKIQCNKHKKIQFTIPQSIDEAVELNSFPQIKEMANHLENYPSCKMIRSLEF
jgi:hypothetical protein